MFRLAAVLLIPASVASAGILPLLTLDKATADAFEKYAAAYQNGPDAAFRSSDKMLIDSQPASVRRDVDAGRLVVEVRRGENVANGHIHHLYGAMHIKGVTAAEVRATMQQYSKYSEYYKPDVAESKGELLPGGTPSDEHFRVEMTLVQSTLWIDVGFQTIYDTHYLRFGARAFETMSKSVSIREYKDAHDPAAGLYANDDGHGFLWGIDTWWHALDRGDGVDIEITNMTLTRPVPFGFGWWATRKARATLEGLLDRTREAVLAANAGR